MRMVRRVSVMAWRALVLVLVGWPVHAAAQPADDPVTFAEHVAPILYSGRRWPIGRCRRGTPTRRLADGPTARCEPTYEHLKEVVRTQPGSTSPSLTVHLCLHTAPGNRECAHEDRCHLGLNKDTPNARAVTPRPSPTAKVVALPRVGGLHHRYEWREAA